MIIGGKVNNLISTSSGGVLGVGESLVSKNDISLPVTLTDFPSSINEYDEITFDITNPQAGVTYAVSTDSGTLVKVNNTRYTFTVPEITTSIEYASLNVIAYKPNYISTSTDVITIIIGASEVENFVNANFAVNASYNDGFTY